MAHQINQPSTLGTKSYEAMRSGWVCQPRSVKKTEQPDMELRCVVEKWNVTKIRRPAEDRPFDQTYPQFGHLRPRRRATETWNIYWMDPRLLIRNDQANYDRFGAGDFSGQSPNGQRTGGRGCITRTLGCSHVRVGRFLLTLFR